MLLHIIQKVIVILIVFSLFSTFLLGLQVLSIQSNIIYSVITSGTSSSVNFALKALKENSPILTAVSWLSLSILLVWHRRVKSAWRRLGFDEQVFELFMRMKGGATRLNLLRSLSSPKDRAQLANELGLDWKTIDRQIQILNKYGFVHEQAAYGRIKVYELTPLGLILLRLIHDLEEVRTEQDHLEKHPNNED